MRENELCIGIIGGTGLGESLRAGFEADEVGQHEPDTPFGKPSAPITTGRWNGVRIALLQRHGEGHPYNPTTVPYRANIHALKSLGCTHIIASGATGSLREHIKPGDVCVCDQIIDRTRRRTLTFYENAAVHIEFADPFCPVMRQWLLNAANTVDHVTVHQQTTYMCMEGPAFSTRAESHMHRQMGGDVIGMTAVPEAKLAREAELPYALLALPTDYDCWRQRDHATDEKGLLEEIIGNLKQAVNASIRLVQSALCDVSYLQQHPCPAADALRLAIWTDKSRIDQDEMARLGVLWGRYFNQ